MSTPACNAYRFAQQGEREFSVSVPVPRTTRVRDVRISVRPDRLTVSVAGHARQPSVLDGELSYDVDADSLTWNIEADASELVLSLEKAEPVDWSEEGLFRATSVPPQPREDARRPVPAGGTPAPLTMGSEASQVLADLMTGKKSLLTPSGIVRAGGAGEG